MTCLVSLLRRRCIWRTSILLIVFVLAMGLPGMAAAQTVYNSAKDTLSYSVEDAVLIALERNPNVSIQRLATEAADTYRREERAEFDPVLSAGITNTESKSQRFLGANREPYVIETKRFQYDMGISETLPTGTTISVDASMSGNNSNIYSDQYTGSVGFTINQSLLRGFGTGVNLAKLRKANLDAEISRTELKGVAEQITADVESAYWDLYLAKEEMVIQRQSMELAEQQLRESEERVAVGKLPELELAVVRAEVASRLEELIQAEGRYEHARLELIFLLNPDARDSWNTLVLPSEKPVIPIDSLDTVEDHVELGLMYRPDLIQARYQLKKGEIDVVQTKNGLLPQLDVFISMGKTSYAETFNAGKPDIGSEFYDVSTGFTFSLPLLDRGERARHARTKNSLRQQEEGLRNMERMVQMDIRSAFIEVAQSQHMIEASKVNRELQEKKLDAEQEKFRVGKSTNFMVLQAQRDYTLSRLAEARSLVSYLNALTNLYLLEGTLLERRHIETGV